MSTATSGELYPPSFKISAGPFTDSCSAAAMIYSTADLIEILARERQACLRGDRLDLLTPPTGHPVFDRFFQTEGLQKYAAFAGFRSRVQDYQQQHHISGLVWQQLRTDGAFLQFPEVHPDLLALESDRLQLQAALPSVLGFWWQVCRGLDCFLAVDRGRAFEPIQQAAIAPIAARSEWATLRQEPRSQGQEWILQLSWGDPAEAQTWRQWPQSGSEYIHAVPTGTTPIA
ncbi:hypothetical protein [Synechococcus elongatus]|nr:hypothetical protein [Synechococcus elongatus]UOW76407.1 hypothetical protein PCC6301pg_1212 [Synechococcus elongatus PCC 6301]AAN40824.1 unknown [Synechococcus elongatus PCC 7942 = FACHB-805]MBD2587589.1 hypothetical protein [Synechococcus elongatus FACHB-242]MBD2707703.1 hypothetical protein [Synechococcus elongatus PCC 7942 = FACHB-805]UOW70966.1 hypothetical protein PCC7943_1212 [Synechococcus elongatus PCC 7943]